MLLLYREIERYIDRLVIIWKSILFFTAIETFVDCWGQCIVIDLENSGMAAAEHVGQIFEVSLNIWLLNRLKQSAAICVQNRAYVGNTYENDLR